MIAAALRRGGWPNTARCSTTSCFRTSIFFRLVVDKIAQFSLSAPTGRVVEITQLIFLMNEVTKFSLDTTTISVVKLTNFGFQARFDGISWSCWIHFPTASVGCSCSCWLWWHMHVAYWAIAFKVVHARCSMSSMSVVVALCRVKMRRGNLPNSSQQRSGRMHKVTFIAFNTTTRSQEVFADFILCSWL